MATRSGSTLTELWSTKAGFDPADNSMCRRCMHLASRLLCIRWRPGEEFWRLGPVACQVLLELAVHRVLGVLQISAALIVDLLRFKHLCLWHALKFRERRLVNIEFAQSWARCPSSLWWDSNVGTAIC